MRERTFRPLVDRLDARLLLDAASAAVVAQVSTTPAPMPGGDIDLNGPTTWYLPGNPPVVPYDPMNPPLDVTIVATTPVATC